MNTFKKNELRLVSIWHDAHPKEEIHFSFYNNSPSDIAQFSLCLSGTLWLTPAGGVKGGKTIRSISNFIQIEPEDPLLKAGAVWSFRLYGLNQHPKHFTDGPQTAYLAFTNGRKIDVAVQPLVCGQTWTDSLLTSERNASVRSVSKSSKIGLAIIPFPNRVSVDVSPIPTDETFMMQMDETTRLDKREICQGVEALLSRIDKTAEPIFSATASEQSPSHQIIFQNANNTELGGNGYKMVFDGPSVIILAKTRTGFTYALISLAQMILGARRDPLKYGFPVRGTIEDLPRFEWRGLALDVARIFYSVPEIMRLMDIQAWFKLNVLHLHLTDDEGWRLPVKEYPELSQIAAWRGHDLPIPPLLGSSHEAYGGSYSEQDIAQLQKHGTLFGITILPEIDIPGHSFASITALPRLRESDDKLGYNTIQGFFGNALNPCLLFTYEFLANVFETVCTQYTSDYVHIGGDEIPDNAWHQSPLANARIQELGLAQTSDLKYLILDYVHEFLNQRGKTTVVWEDAIHNSDLTPSQTTAIVWKYPDKSVELAERGYNVVLSPGTAYYLDMAETDHWSSPGNHWAGSVSLAQTYDFDPEQGWSPQTLDKLKGVHACIWGDYMIDKAFFNALVFPRLQAVAERAWITPSNKNFAGFIDRLAVSQITF